MSLAQMNPAMDEAWGVIKYLSGDEQERALAESWEKARRDLAAMYDTAREEGREEGVQLGEENASRRIAS